MMKYCFFLLVFLVCACRNTGKVVSLGNGEDGDATVIDFSVLGKEGVTDSVPFQNLLPLSSFGEKMQVVKLETGKDCLVDGKAKYFIGNDFILVVQSDQVMLFGMDGRFYRTIARNGRGPSEYGQVEDMAVDEKSGFVYLLDEFGNMKMYHLTDSIYFKSFKAAGEDRFYNSMLALDGGKILLVPCLYKETKHLLFVQDTSGQFISGVVCPPNDDNLLVDGKRLAYRVGEDVLYLSRAKDTVYRWTGEGLTPQWVFKMGELQDINVNGESNGSLFLTLSTEIERKQEGNSTLTTHSNRSYYYDKKKGGMFSFGNLWDDHFMSCYLEPRFLQVQQGQYFYIPYPASLLDELIPQVLQLEDKDLSLEKRQRLQELQKTLSPDDNPVLLIGRLK